MNGTTQFLQHDFQRGVLGKLDHEHAGLHADVARVWGTYGKNGVCVRGLGLQPLAWAGGGAGEESGGEKADTPLLSSTGTRLLT